MAETSDYTSAQKRVADVKRRGGSALLGKPAVVHGRDQDGAEAWGSEARKYGGKSGGPCPPYGGGRSAQRTLLSGQNLAPVDLKEGKKAPGPDVHKAGRRCSNKGFLPISTADYLDLLDWTARQVRTGKRGATPRGLPQLFERLGISESVWFELVSNFGKLFSVVAGQPAAIDEHRSGGESVHRYRARREARELMVSC